MSNCSDNEITHMISFSGGRTSAFMVLEVLKMHPDAEVVFCNTSAEHPKTYKFIRDFQSHFGVNITVLEGDYSGKPRDPVSLNVTDVFSMDEDMGLFRKLVERSGMPYLSGAFCSDRLKKEMFEKYANSKHGKNGYIRWIGIRADEPRRLKNKKENYRYLADISDLEKEDIVSWWSERELDLEIPEHLGNCVFCIKKSIPKLAMAIHDEPELYDKFVMECAESPLLRGGDKAGEIFNYRGRMSLTQIHDLYSHMEYEEIKKEMRLARRFDSGSCTESCEAI